MGSTAAVLGVLLMMQLNVQPTQGRVRGRDDSSDRKQQVSIDRADDVQQERSARATKADLDSDATVTDAAPRLLVDETRYDFGRMDPYTAGRHAFVIRNEGPGPLRLLDHRSTCACTIGQFTRRPIAAGDTTEVIVEWRTQTNNVQFEQSAIIETNDPQQPQLSFTITGKVLVHAGANPQEFSLPSVRPDSRESASTVISSQVWTDFSLHNIHSSLDGLDWTVDDVTDAERTELRSLSAKRITIQLPDNIPEGHFTHWLRFELVPDDLEAKPLEYQLPIRGKVLKRLAVYGPGIDSSGNVKLGVIDTARGLKRRLMLKVYDRDTDLVVQQITADPDFLAVTVTPHNGQPFGGAETQDKASAHGLYLLDIEVPPTAPVCAHQDQEAGFIELRFDHPRIMNLNLRVHFAVAARLADAN